MKNIRISFSISTIIALITVIYVAYYLLLRENCLHSSISSIIGYSHHVAVKEHLLILGLLPIYIAAMIFGAATLGLYLGNRLESFILHRQRNK